MTVWEFSNNNLAFKRSSTKPAPSIEPWLRQHLREVITTSMGEYLIIVYWDRHYLHFVQSCYDGRDWKFKEYKPRRSSPVRGEVTVVSDGHAIVAIRIPPYINTAIYSVFLEVIAPLLNFDKEKGAKEFIVPSCATFDALLSESKYFTTFHNQQLFFIDLQGVIFTSFIRPPIVPVVWGSSHIKFQDTPHMMKLPDGTMLMIGMVGCQHGSQLDIIKIHLKGNNPVMIQKVSCTGI